jgi:hypothetical protein
MDDIPMQELNPSHPGRAVSHRSNMRCKGQIRGEGKVEDDKNKPSQRADKGGKPREKGKEGNSPCERPKPKSIDAGWVGVG